MHVAGRTGIYYPSLLTSPRVTPQPRFPTKQQLQDLIVYADGGRHQRPPKVELHCKARWYHKPCTNGAWKDIGSSFTMELEVVICADLSECLEMWQLNHNYWFSQKEIKTVWNEKFRPCCPLAGNVRHLFLKAPGNRLSWHKYSRTLVSPHTFT